MEKEQHSRSDVVPKLYDEAAIIGLSEDSIGYNEVIRLSSFLRFIMGFECLRIEDEERYDRRAFEFDMWYNSEDIEYAGLILRPIYSKVEVFTILSWSPENNQWVIKTNTPTQHWAGMLLEQNENGEKNFTYLKDNQVPSEISMDYKMDIRNSSKNDEQLLMNTDQLHDFIRNKYII